MSKKYNRSEDNGLLDTFILCVLLKGHKTWRVVATNRKMAKLEDVLKTLKKSREVEKVNIYKMDGISGEITFNF
jgi:hypothetical protein